MITNIRVPYINLALQHQKIKKEIGDAIERVLDSGGFILGPEVESFEKKIATATSKIQRKILPLLWCHKRLQISILLCLSKETSIITETTSHTPHNNTSDTFHQMVS